MNIASASKSNSLQLNSKIALASCLLLIVFGINLLIVMFVIIKIPIFCSSWNLSFLISLLILNWKTITGQGVLVVVPLQRMPLAMISLQLNGSKPMAQGTGPFHKD